MRIKEELSYSGKVGRNSERKYFTLGWMIWHSSLKKYLGEKNGMETNRDSA